jgi:hypothetical protein
MIPEGGFSFSNKQIKEILSLITIFIQKKNKKKFIDAFKYHRKLEILFRLE